MKAGLSIGLVLATAACTRANDTVKTVEPASDAAYPPVYPVLDEAELARRTSALEAAAPGWRITLDPMGLLDTARCSDACAGADSGPLSADDREKVDQFLGANDDIVVTKSGKPTTAGGALVYMQPEASGAIQSVWVTRRKSKLEIRQHLWPRLPSAEAKPDAELQEALRQLESGTDPVIYRTNRIIARSLEGPVEIRIAACARGKRRPHACVDAHTGEDISNLGVEISIETKDGVVTKRGLRRPSSAI